MMIWTMSRKYKLFLFCVRLICHLPELIWWSRSRVTKKSCQSLQCYIMNCNCQLTCQTISSGNKSYCGCKVSAKYRQKTSTNSHSAKRDSGGQLSLTSQRYPSSSKAAIENECDDITKDVIGNVGQRVEEAVGGNIDMKDLVNAIWNHCRDKRK